MTSPTETQGAAHPAAPHLRAGRRRNAASLLISACKAHRRIEEILRPTKVLREAEVDQTRALRAKQAQRQSFSM